MDWKNIEFDYMFKDEVATHVKIENGVVSVIHSDKVLKPFKLLMGRETVYLSDLEKVFARMVFPYNRVNRNELLENMGLKEYNVHDIIEYTHGVMYNSYNWIRFMGESLTCKDVRDFMGIE